MTDTPITFRRHLRTGFAWAGWVLALWTVSGCVTPWERSALLNDKRADIGDVQGPTQRRLNAFMRDQKKKDAEDDKDPLLKPIAGTEEYLAAEELYKNDKFAEAEKAFKKIAKNKKYKKSEIREDAIFMEAEAAYAQEHYGKAHDLYRQVLKDFPTTRHLDKISGRLFKIAMIWLDHPQIAQMEQIQQVNHEKYGEKLPPEEPVEQKKRNVLKPNFTDKARPMFDPQGNALSALRAIWTNDPTGPLADDSLMLAASYYARSGDFIEADRHYTMLREQFPNSPHVQKAFEIGSHVKLMSYQGAPYDGKTLQDAKQLKLATLRLYPEMENKQRLETELAKIEQAEGDRLWEMVVFYERKGYKKAAAIYCHLLLKEHPQSRHVADVKQKLDQFGPAYAEGRALQSPYPDPPRTVWTAIFPPDDRDWTIKPTPPPAPKQSIAQSSRSDRWKFVKTPKDSPQKASPAERDEDLEEVASKKSSSSRQRPRQLPDEVDTAARPSSKSRSRQDGPRPASNESDDEDNEGGHTRL